MLHQRTGRDALTDRDALKGVPYNERCPLKGVPYNER